MSEMDISWLKQDRSDMIWITGLYITVPDNVMSSATAGRIRTEGLYIFTSELLSGPSGDLQARQGKIYKILQTGFFYQFTAQ